MTKGSSADWEMAIVLPLGVVANQLRRIEEQLRFLDMKALTFARERENANVRALIDAKLEHISEALRAIAALTSNIAADIRPDAPDVTRLSMKDATAPPGSWVASDDTRSSPDTVDAGYSRHKSHADQDD